MVAVALQIGGGRLQRDQRLRLELLRQIDVAAGGRVDLAWDSLPAQLPAPKKIARLTAWVLAAERAARPFSLRAPGIALAAGQGRDHRRSALTALALMPEHYGQADAQAPTAPR